MVCIGLSCFKIERRKFSLKVCICRSFYNLLLVNTSVAWQRDTDITVYDKIRFNEKNNFYKYCIIRTA